MTFISLDEAMRERRKERRAAKDHPRHANGQDTRPEMVVETDNVEEVVDKSEAALIASGRGLYQRGGRIVYVGAAKVIAADEREVATQRIFERGDHALHEDLCAAAVFKKYDGRSQGMRIVEPQMRIVKVLKERGPPSLSGADCRHQLPDAARGWLDPRQARIRCRDRPFVRSGRDRLRGVSNEPTRADAEAALAKLRGLIRTFPFVQDTDRSVALSAMMTAVVRRSLPTAPMHALSAPVAGSGNSKLVDIASVIATGRQAGVIAQGKTEEESEKRLGSVLLAGDAVLAIDNCEAPVGGDLLCQVLTQSTVRIRILGRSETVKLPTGALMTATGNNLVVLGDMTRRTLLGTLDPEVEQPEKRTFDSDPIAVVKADRGAYVVAALTILRGYIAAGRPRQVSPLGSFEAWSDLVRSALIWLGEADPVSTMEDTRARDPRLDELHAVVAQWAAVLGTEKTTIRNVIAKATEKTSASNFDFNPSSFTKPDFREALLAVAGVGGAINSRRLGAWIGKQKKRIVSVTNDPIDTDTEFPARREIRRWRFQSGPMRDGFTTWYLEEVPSPLLASSASRSLARRKVDQWNEVAQIPVPHEKCLVSLKGLEQMHFNPLIHLPGAIECKPAV